MAEKTDELLTTKEACAFLRVSASTIYRMERKGLISSFRTPGGQRRFSRKELLAYLEKSRAITHKNAHG